jgi:hypothetical protein
MEPQVHIIIQSYLVIGLLAWMVYANHRCCREAQEKLAALSAWLYAHWEYEKKLIEAVCAIEAVLAGETGQYDTTKRICPDGGGDGYGQGSPPGI